MQLSCSYFTYSKRKKYTKYLLPRIVFASRQAKCKVTMNATKAVQRWRGVWR